MSLARALLVVLDQVRPNLMPLLPLLVDVTAQGLTITQTEVRQELERLEALHFVTSVRSVLDNSIRYGITDKGRAVLAD